MARESLKHVPAALALAAALVAAPVTIDAQALARLTVQTFWLTSDTPRPRVDQPFHLIVTLRVRERVAQITNLELPLLADVELLGDERQTVSGRSGTLYRETITVVAHRGGSLAIAPATLQAIDARDGKAKQWYTNSLTLNVVGVSTSALRAGASQLLSRAVAVLRVLLWVLGVAVVACLIAILLRRGRRSVVVVPRASEPAPAPPIVVRTPRDQLQDALVVLRAERTRASAVAVRGAIWRMIGANDGATLGDVLRRRESVVPETRELLIALERGAFTYDDDLQAAIQDACFALERAMGSLA
ncbi:MAG TPA: hypothetical protein VMT95_04105 [Candidatus Binatia bacterium]|nr:hypothetical protein [Candidatus Binatia bacterium]